MLGLFPDASAVALSGLGTALLLGAAAQALLPRPRFGSVRGHLALALIYLAPAAAMAILGHSAAIALAATMFVGPLTAVWIADRRWAAGHLILASAALLAPPLLGLTGDAGLAASLRLLPSMWVLGILCLLVLETAEAQGGELERLARTDALTGVGNRRLLEERLTEVQRRHSSTGAPYALVVLDLDGFKAVNDRLGHHAGDAVLQQVAAGLTSTVRAYDTVVRLGGDEFVVLLPDTTAEEATRVRELLRAGLGRIAIADAALSAGLGLATCPSDGTDPDDLLRIADARLLAQKRAPRAPRATPSPSTLSPVASSDACRQITIDISRHALAQHRWIWALSGVMFLVNALMALALRWRAPEFTTWALPWVAAWGIAVAAIVLLTRPPRIGTRANHLFLLAGHLTPLGTLLACQPGGSVGIGSSIFIGPLIAARLVERRQIAIHLLVVSALFLAAAASGALDQTSMLAVATLVGSFWVLAICITVVLEMAEQQGTELQEAVRRDPLTGAANRRHLEEWLERELARTNRRGSRVGLVAMDLDDFKQINDTLGHAAGDALLCDVAQTLLAAVDGQAVIARTGGDEFVVATEVRSTEELDQLACACARALRQVEGPFGPIGGGVGTASSRADSTVDSLLIEADRQLITAKQSTAPRTPSRHPHSVNVQMWSP